MKKIIRRLTAFALCAILAAAMPLASAQELMTPEGGLLTVQIVITQPDGTMSLLPVTPVTNTMGNTVYWVDESMLSDDEIASLSTAQLQLVSETGELYAEMPLLESGFAGAIDERLDIVNDMIPGGVLDAAEKGTPGELKMPPEMVKAVCDQAHAMGYPVAAHTESPEGVKVALENGVDSIEHGAKMDEETVKLYKEHGAFLCTTISPALPYALFDTAVSGASEKDQYNGRIVFDGIVESAKTALANGIPVGLGNDVGCPYITQYDFWRELCYFHKYCGVSNQFALYTATLRNARLAGVGDVTGSLEVGKSEDLIVTRQNPLEDLRALQHLELVVCRGHVVKKPNPKRNKTVDALLDPYLA